MRKALIVAAVLLAVAVCAGTVEAAELHTCDFCGKGMGGSFSYEYQVLSLGVLRGNPEFCSKRCIVAYFSGYKPADTKIKAQIEVPASKEPVCFCWWCRLTRWLGFGKEA